MPDTGWRELTDTGWNLLAAPEAHSLSARCQQILEPLSMPQNVYGDGQAAQAIVSAVQQILG